MNSGKGQAPVSGGYIELRHSKQPDPAIRREQLIRAGASLSATTSSQSATTSSQSTTSSDVKPNMSVLSTKSESSIQSTTATSSTVDSVSVPASSAPTSTASLDDKLKVVKVEPVDNQQADVSGFQVATSVPVSESVSPCKSNETKDSTESKIQASPDDVNTDKESEKETVAPDRPKQDEKSSPSKTDQLPNIEESEKETEKDASSNAKEVSNQDNAEAENKNKSSSAENAVSNEHSYVKSSSDGMNDQNVAEIQLSSEDKNEPFSAVTTCTVSVPDSHIAKEVPSDGVIHGVGMTPPADITTVEFTSLEDDGQQVCNVVTVEKDSEVDVKSMETDNKKTSDLESSGDGVSDVIENAATGSTPPTTKQTTTDVNTTSVSTTDSDIVDNIATSTAVTTVLTVQNVGTNESTSNLSKSVDSQVDSDLPSQKTSVDESQTKTSLEKPTENVQKSLNADENSKQILPQAQTTTEVNKSSTKEESVLTTIPETNTNNSESIITASLLPPPETTNQNAQAVLTDSPSVTSAGSVPFSNESQTTTEVVTQTVETSSSCTTTVNVSSIDTIPVNSLPASSSFTSQPVLTTTTAPVQISTETSQSEDTLQASNYLTSDNTEIARSLMQTCLSTEVTNTSPLTTTSVTTENVVSSAASLVSEAAAVHSQFTLQKQQPAGIMPHQQTVSKKPLLIKEQPLLLQDLLDQEKKEQEKARREKLSQAMMQPPAVMYSANEMEGDRILQAKMKILSGISQVIKGNSSQPVPEGPAPPGQAVQHSIGTTHWPHAPNAPHMLHPSGALNVPSGSENDLQKRKSRYEEWLFQHQALLQMQVKALEQASKQHRSKKQALTKKQRQSRKTGEEFSQADVHSLSLVTQQQVETDRQLHELREKQERHSELVQDYNLKQGSVQTLAQTGNNLPVNTIPSQPGDMMHAVPQQPYQQQLQPPSAIRPPLPDPATLNLSLAQQSVNINRVVQSAIPGQSSAPISHLTATVSATPAVGSSAPQPALVTSTSSSPHNAMQGGMTMQQREALFAQLQKIPGIQQMSSSQIQQLMMQHSSLMTTPSTLSSHFPVVSSSPKQLTQSTSVMGTSTHLPVNPQMMMPSTLCIRPPVPGQIDATRGQMMQAQVASVNINVGSNMVTAQGTMMRPVHPGSVDASGKVIDPTFMQMHHQMPMEAQQRMPIMQPEEKPKRRRKKKKKVTTAENPAVDSHFLMALGTSPSNTDMHMSSAGLAPRMTTPVSMLMSYQQSATSGGMMRPSLAPHQQWGINTTSSAVSSHLELISSVSNISSIASTPQHHPSLSSQATTSSLMSPLTGAAVPSQSMHPIPVASSSLMTGSAMSTAVTQHIGAAFTLSTSHSPSKLSMSFPHDKAPIRTSFANNAPSSIGLVPPTFSQPMVPGPPRLSFASPTSVGVQGRNAGLMIAGQPLPVSNIKKEQSSPQLHLKTDLPVCSPQSVAASPRLLALTESELEIIMATDPDSRSTTTTPDTSIVPSSSPLIKVDQISPVPPTDSSKLLRRGVSEDDEHRSLIDSTITSVIRDGMEYYERLELAKETGAVATPPSWMRDPKPTKFPSKPPTPLHQHPSLKGAQLHGMATFAPQMFSHSLNTNHQELLRHMLKPGSGGMLGPFTGIDKAGIEMSPEQMKKQLEIMGSPYAFKMDESQKKKRSRRASKDKDGKEKVKKKRKKKHHNHPDEDILLPGVPRGHDVMGMSLHRGFGDDHSPGKPQIQRKPLPLLPLVEPDIKINYSMCMPKGTGLTQSKSLLEGTIGNATMRGLPDYYDLLICKDPYIYMDPPTPPSSLPPSPKRERMNSLDDSKSELNSYSQHVKVPDSLPTPPHQGSENIDDIAAMRLLSDDVVAPSSPEPDDDKEPFSGKFPSMLSVAYKEEPKVIPPPPSPPIPLLGFPKEDVMDEEDQLSVTFSFKQLNSKQIKKSLTQLSRILGTSIVGFRMEDSDKSIKSEKDASQPTDQQKDANLAADSLSNSLNPNSTHQRRCYYCNQLVVGNGVRKPLFGENLQDEDIIFCNKQCFLTNEFENKVQLDVPTTKKKWKASQVYQRHTCKIDITSLISANPDPEFISTRGRMGGSASTPDAYDDSNLRSADGKGRGRGRRRGSSGPGDDGRTAKRWKGIKWKKWNVGVTVIKSVNHKPPPDVDALLSKYGSALKPPSEVTDTRQCVLCSIYGDGDTKGVARLLNLDVDQWVHLNCALWSQEVYETQGGALINVDLAVRNSMSVMCVICQKKGATIHCHRSRCTNVYHCACAIRCGCQFYKDKTVLCPSHSSGVPGQVGNSQHHDQLKSLAVFRKVYVQRKETKQIASIMQQGEFTQGEKNYILRVGALMFYAVGQLSTHQMTQFHSKTAIYPVGYKATRIYWSSNNTRKRVKYTCMITEKEGKPWFTTRYQAVASRPKTLDKNIQGEWMEMVGELVNEKWLELLQQLANLRSQQKMLKLFPAYINGENIFGLTSPVVCRILESLPNIELCANYKFRYGRSPLLELPLAINPTGSARSEPHIKHSRKKPHTLISNLISEYYESTGIGDASSSLYGKHFVHSKSSQYRRMKQEWRNNVHLARSRIQGLGLFAGRDIEPGTMVIEYIGEIIRSEVAEKREKKYEAANRGVYMFRLDSDYIVDATVTGGPARYINHSCNPNCVAEVVNFEKEKKIMIISNRHILSGEELNYDYKFDFEDEGNKIPCLCGSINCRKWMN